MNRLLFLFLLLVPSLMAQPAPFLRNAWTTNAAGTPVQGQDNLSVTNLGSGTNWLFHSVRPQTIARLIDITNVALAVGGGTNYWTNDPPGYLRPITVTNSIYSGTNQSRGYYSGDLNAAFGYWGAPISGLQFVQAADASIRSVPRLEGLVLSANMVDFSAAWLDWIVTAQTNTTKQSSLQLNVQEAGGDQSTFDIIAQQDPASIANRKTSFTAIGTSGSSNASFVLSADTLSSMALLEMKTLQVQGKPFLVCSTNNSNVFKVSGDGNIDFLRKISYFWPTSQGAAQSVLTNDGAGVLGWGTAASGGGDFNINQFSASATHTNIKSGALLTNAVMRNLTNVGVVEMTSGTTLEWPGFAFQENVPSGDTLILSGNYYVTGTGRFDSNVTVLGTNIVNWGQYPLLTASRALVLNANNGVAVASGTPDGTKFLRDDNTYAVPPGGSATPGGIEANLQVNMGGAFVGSTNTFYDVTNSTLGIGTNVAFGRVHIRQTGTNAIARFDSGIQTNVLVVATNRIEPGSDLFFIPDNTYSIGDGATETGRPLDVTASRNINAGRLFKVGWSAWGGFTSVDDGRIKMQNNNANNFTALQWGTSTDGFPAIGRTNGHLIVFGAGSIAFAGGSTNGLIVSGDLSALTNSYVFGTNDVRYLKLSGGVPAGSILRTDSNTNVVAATIGTGLSFDGTTLTATASGGGATTNANQFGVAAELTIKSGALLTNVLFYPSNLTGPATIHLPTTAQMTNLTEWRGTNGTVGLAISSNGLALVQERLDLANAVAFRTNNIDFRLNTYQAFTASLKTNLVLQLTNTYEGVTTRLDAYGAGRLGGGATNAWQLLCTVASGVNIYWPPGTTNGNYDVLVNSNQVVSFTFMGGLGSTNILASYRVLEGIGAN